MAVLTVMLIFTKNVSQNEMFMATITAFSYSRMIIYHYIYGPLLNE